MCHNFTQPTREEVPAVTRPDSFGVKALNKAIFGKDAKLLEFNLSQFKGTDELIGAFQVRESASWLWTRKNKRWKNNQQRIRTCRCPQ